MLSLVSAVDRPQLRINLDLYHTQIGEGDLVRVIECRPLSRQKRWRLVDVIEKAR